jgi:hypothetical protein
MPPGEFQNRTLAAGLSGAITIRCRLSWTIRQQPRERKPIFAEWLPEGRILHLPLGITWTVPLREAVSTPEGGSESERTIALTAPLLIN